MDAQTVASRPTVGRLPTAFYKTRSTKLHSDRGQCRGAKLKKPTRDMAELASYKPEFLSHENYQLAPICIPAHSEYACTTYRQ